MPSLVAGSETDADGRDKPSHDAEDMAQPDQNELLGVFWMLRPEGAGG